MLPGDGDGEVMGEYLLYHRSFVNEAYYLHLACGLGLRSSVDRILN